MFSLLAQGLLFYEKINTYREFTLSEPTFRKESVDYIFSPDGKPFFVMSPPGFSLYTFLILSFFAMFALALTFIRLPVHIKAFGEVLAGEDYYQISYPASGMNVINVYISEGDSVVEGQTIMRLKNRDLNQTKRDIADIESKILRTKSHFDELDAHIDESLSALNVQRDFKNKLIAQLIKSIKHEKAVLGRYESGVETGLMPIREADNQRRLLVSNESSLIREQSGLATLSETELSLHEKYSHERDTALDKLSSLGKELASLKEGIEIVSPCDCVVANILTKENVPAEPSKSLLTLSEKRPDSELILYFPSSKYRGIEIGKNISVTVSAYPAAKYGMVEASVTSVSSMPIPGSMIRSKSGNLQEGSYFVVKAIIDKVPESMTLSTGMVINSDVVIDKKPLLGEIFNFGHAH